MTDLVTAACAENGRAGDAFARWQAVTDVERLSPGEYEILPLLFQNLVRLGTEHPWMPRLRGIYRRTWLDNQFALVAASRALDILEGAGLAPLLVGPAALAVTEYRGPGMRPIGTPRVLVSTSKRLAALDALRATGWHLQPGRPEALTSRRQRWRPHELLLGPEGGPERPERVLLCWHTLPQEPSAGFTAESIARAVPMASPGMNARTLDPTDHLLHALTAAPVSALIPLVDGIKLIQNHSLDWSTLASTAARHACGLVLTRRLRQIQRTGAVDLPESTLAEMETHPHPFYAEVLWDAGQIPTRERTAYQRIRVAYAGFQQKATALGLPARPFGFYEYLQARFAADSLATLTRRARR